MIRARSSLEKRRRASSGLGHLGADALVIVEGVVVRLVREGARPRLGDVVEERGDAEDRLGRARVEAGHGVAPDVVRVPLVLRAADGLAELRAGDGEDARAAHGLEGDARPAARMRLDPLVPHALRAHPAEGLERARRSHGPLRLGAMAQPSVAEKRAARSTRRPSSAKRSSGSPTARITRAAQIPPAVEGVDEVAVDRIDGHGVDR